VIGRKTTCPPGGCNCSPLIENPQQDIERLMEAYLIYAATRKCQSGEPTKHR
jgi:hypothetical protein